MTPLRDLLAVAAAMHADWSPVASTESHVAFSRRVKLPGGPMAGLPYDPDSDPIQRWLLEQFDSRRWRSIAWLAPPQIAGKTTCAVVIPALRGVIAAKCSVGYGLPTLHDLDRGWTTKVAPMIRSAGFGDYLPQKGPGSRGGRPLAAVFEDPHNGRAALGSLVFLAGGARQVTCQVVLLDEVDAWRDYSSGEPRWQDVLDAFARADSFGDMALRVATSTLETDDPAKSIIWQLAVVRGSGTRWYHQCPACGHFAPAEWERFQFEYAVVDGLPDLQRARNTARFVCFNCGVAHDDAGWRQGIFGGVAVHRGQSVEGGRPTGPEPATADLGLRTTALDCVLTSLPSIAETAAKARFALETVGDHEVMRKYYRYVRCEPYRGDLAEDGSGGAEELTAEAVARRSRSAWAAAVYTAADDERWSRYHAPTPADADGIVAAIDVQHSRLYTAALAGAREARLSWHVGWSLEYGPGGGDDLRALSESELFEVLDQAADWLESLATTTAPFVVGLVDVSDSTRMDTLAAWLERRGPPWAAVTGEPRLPKGQTVVRRGPFVAWERRWRPGRGCWRVVTEDAQRALQRALCVAPNEPGASMLPTVKPSVGYVRHLVALGVVRGRWQKRPGAGRHDWFDAAAYAYAVLWPSLESAGPRGADRADESEGGLAPLAAAIESALLL